MRILFITDLYPLEGENMTGALSDFVLEWHKSGHNIEVIRPNFILNTLLRGRKIIKEKIYFENGIKVYNLNFITPFLFDVRKKLPCSFSLGNYDIMISHMPSGALFALRLLEKENIKYICSVHASDITVLNDFKYKFYFRNRLKQAYLKADKISARSPVLKQKIEKIISGAAEKTFTAYSGLNKDFYKTAKIKEFNKKMVNIFAAASFIRRKNIDIIIKALSKADFDYKLTIAGEGRELKRLKQLAESLSIADKTEFTGRLERAEVFEIMRKNDIFILLSRSETFGLVYLEAAAAGNIVIAKHNDGIEGLLQDGRNAFYIDADKNSLINCLKKIMNMPEENLAEIRKNAQKTAEFYTIENAAKNYLDNITA